VVKEEFVDLSSDDEQRISTPTPSTSSEKSVGKGRQTEPERTSVVEQVHILSHM
jgi:hypothetical protein